MKKALLTIFLLVFISGCIGNIPGCGGGSTSDQYRAGSQGIVLSFVENAPPATVFDTDNFIVGVKATNMGAESADVDIYLSGFDSNVVQIDTSANTYLNGKVDVFNPGEGESQVISLNQHSTNLGDADSYSPTFMVTACYHYKTIAKADVCINGDPTFNKGVCTPSNIQLSGGQGGPVGVTGIDVAATPGKTNFKVYIKNLGSGGPCEDTQTRELKEVTVESITVHNTGLDCKPLSSGRLKLINGEGVLYCEMPGIDLDDVYTTPMVITLSYDYSDVISKTVQIIKAPR